VLSRWLVESAAQLADTLRGAGPDAQLWTPVPGGTTKFYARRFAHETVIHRADAILAVRAEFIIDEEVASTPSTNGWSSARCRCTSRSIPGCASSSAPGRTLRFHATDTARQPAPEWLVDLTGDAIVWRRTHEKAAVAVRGPLLDLLLVIYKRRPARGEGIEILGDMQLLDFWLDRVSFG
jgi:hypothetical protein